MKRKKKRKYKRWSRMEVLMLLALATDIFFRTLEHLGY